MRAFLEIPNAWRALDGAAFVVLPVPYERTVSFAAGTALGPEAILEASWNLETFDDELGCDTAEAGVHTLPLLRFDGPPEALADRLEEIATFHIRAGRFVVGIGGEHSISLGLVRAHAAAFPGLSVLHLDAHADLRDEYRGSRFGHACVMRRVREHAPLVQVGIRSLTSEEAALARGDTGIRTFFAHAMRPLARSIPEIASALAPQVYVSLDIDVIDAALHPATGTPEPGGLSWDEVVAILRETARAREIVGLDLVEHLPLAGGHAWDSSAAKLIYRAMGFVRTSRIRAARGGA
ncbi:MAG: agmatinase [Planctomycetes bacterium]|nr:agmatinase [Planctomycetota bacterium]